MKWHFFKTAYYFFCVIEMKNVNRKESYWYDNILMISDIHTTDEFFLFVMVFIIIN